MKHCFSYLFIIQFISFFTLYSHGFDARTYVQTGYNNQKTIKTVYYEHKDNVQPLVLTQCSDNIHTQKVVGHIKGITNCYFKIGFDEWFNDDILCTPSQEFFVPDQQKWIPVCQLKVGDVLLNKYDQWLLITHMEFVPRPLKIYAIEVEHTHNYFVGHHAILTHNIPIPWAFSIGLELAFGGSSTAGGILGMIGATSFSMCGGVVIGGLVGLTIYALEKNGYPKLKFEFDIPTFQGINWTDYDSGPFLLADPSLYYKMDEEKKLYAAKNKNTSGNVQGNSNGSCSGGGDPQDPRNRGSQGNNPPRNSNNNQPERKLPQHPLTNKEARELAKKWGYKEDKNPPFKTHGALAFKKGNQWISPDQDCHNGGVWKFMQRINGVVQRVATLNIDGSPINK
ncbi:MAG: polymorphic toxin-type HINT domain-containing protein [Candidatus Babeliaceae bacterium]